MKNKEMVKHNINFLEYPLWFQDKVIAEESENGFIWEDRAGYVYRSGYKIPTKTDAIFLLYFLLQSQKNNYCSDFMVSRYKVLKDCELSIDSKWYSRLQESLNRWLRVDVAFKGKFYDDKEYQHIAFHILDSWSIDNKTKQLKVSFSPNFLKMMMGKGFFKYVNFYEFKALHSPLATRLYEIICKSFEGRNTWAIDAVKLAEKIPMNERFPADIVPKIQAAVNRINKHTASNYKLEIRRPKRGKAVFVFHKLTDNDNCPIKEKLCQPDLIPKDKAFESLLALLPPERRNQKTLQDMISQAWKLHGSDYVSRNIRYAVANAKKNFRKFLAQSLAGDWGLSMIEDEEAVKQTKQMQAETARQAHEIHRPKRKSKRLKRNFSTAPGNIKAIFPK